MDMILNIMVLKAFAGAALVTGLIYVAQTAGKKLGTETREIKMPDGSTKIAMIQDGIVTGSIEVLTDERKRELEAESEYIQKVIDGEISDGKQDEGSSADNGRGQDGVDGDSKPAS